MAVMVQYRLMAKKLITTIQVSFVLIPSEAGIRQPPLLILTSTYTIIAIYWPPPLIFSHWIAILNRAAPFFTAWLFFK